MPRALIWKIGYGGIGNSVQTHRQLFVGKSGGQASSPTVTTHRGFQAETTSSKLGIVFEHNFSRDII